MAVHQTFRLNITPEKFYIEPLDSGSSGVLIIDRVSQELSLHANENVVPPSASNQIIYGILGIIRLIAGPYLVVVTKRVKVGEIIGKTIWKVTGTELISYKRTNLHMNEQQISDNKTYVSMVEYILRIDSYYFSTDFDITHSLQRLHNTSPEFMQMSLHERADPRFLWNGHLLKELGHQSELSCYCLPILHGFVSISECNLNGEKFVFSLISRRSCYRAGVRYYTRGVDSDGHSANSVETEQIVEHRGTHCSFVQTRGSVPLFWNQKPNLKYKPDPQLSTTHNQIDGFNHHFDSQIYTYGTQVLVNLLNQTGKEERLVRAYEQMVKTSENSNIKYQPFDFHHECKKMRWDRLSILVDKVQKEQKKFGYFLTSQDGKSSQLQEGVFRTNCIDCLDRTNVVQSLFARVSLQDQLEYLGILQSGQLFQNNIVFEKLFKNVWADNGDACAKQYAGTGALKTDFTRLGKRTKIGLLKDGYNSGMRYLMNNFYDGFRQDSIDLFLGNYIVNEQESSTVSCPLRVEKDWKVYALPAIFIVAFSMCVISILIPDEHPSEQFMYILFWGTASVITLGVIYFFGQEFVDKPKLS